MGVILGIMICGTTHSGMKDNIPPRLGGVSSEIPSHGSSQSLTLKL